jgi:hypothetical protein
MLAVRLQPNSVRSPCADSIVPATLALRSQVPALQRRPAARCQPRAGRRHARGRLRAQVLCDFAGGVLSLFQLCLEVRTLPQGPPPARPSRWADHGPLAACRLDSKLRTASMDLLRQAPALRPDRRVTATADLAAVTQ